jgi:hypothetical protein
MSKRLQLVLASVLVLSACSPAQLLNAAKTIVKEELKSGNSPARTVTGSTGSSSSSSSSGSTSTSKGWSDSVTWIEAEANKTVAITDSFDKGLDMPDLSWASTSTMACFPATQNAKFRGKHVFFAATLPPRSIMNIRVKPADDNADLSLYAYQIGTTRYDLPPKISSAVSCEADHKWDYPKKDKPPQGSSREVMLNATTNPYNVLIGVSGPAGVSGDFTLEVELKQ